MCREWRCSWSSADRRCSNYLWVITNFIALLPNKVRIILEVCGNLLARGRCIRKFYSVICEHILRIKSVSTFELRWMPQNTIGDKSTLVQVMAWCPEATSNFLSQCCPRPVSPYGVTMSWWFDPEYVLKDLGHKLHRCKSLCVYYLLFRLSTSYLLLRHLLHVEIEYNLKCGADNRKVGVF